MKRYFVLWTAATLAFSALATGQSKTNLQLILEGPFAICEDTTRHLIIYVPNLQGTHNVAGFSGPRDQYTPGGGPDYLTYPDGPDYVMEIQRKSTPATLMALLPNNADLYSEHGTCSSPVAQLESFSLKVPDADEVWALNPTMDSEYVIEHKTQGGGQPQGPQDCKDVTKGCQYATKIVLLYKNVDLMSVCLADPKDATNPCTGNNGGAWRPNSDGIIDGDFQIELSAEPIDTGDYQKHAKAAFRIASNLSGIQRELVYATPKRHPFYPPLHQVCQAPPLIFCTTGPACNQKP